MCAAIEWNSQLISRYGHGASCGSYPHISQFHRGITSLDLLRALRTSRRAGRPLALAVQLPMASRNGGAISGYLDGLEREVDLLSCHLGAQQRVEQFHLSGGTPSAAGLNRLMGHLHQRFNFQLHPLGDYSIEIELPHADWATMGLLRELGFNHVSIGVPDINPLHGGALLDFQNPQQVRSLLDATRALHFRSVNIDLGYGRAWQTTASFARKAAAIIELQPSRVQLFDYAHPPRRYRGLKRFVASGFAAQSDKRAMHRHAVAQLLGAGYSYIGLGQFALADDALASAQEDACLQHNWQGYSRQGHCDHLGLGVAAISQIGDLYLQNIGDVQRYQEQLAMGQLAVFHGLRCSPDEQLRSVVIETLLCDFYLDLRGIEARFGVLLRDYFAPVWAQLEQMADDGLIALSATSLSVPPAGRLLVGAVCKVLESSRCALADNPQQRFRR
ncbi:MAG: coproporphyrinogen III oxidase [Pseudomonas sp.]|uniref:coproporphyrinogen III oxidase n=1 Tax=Pseudomonas sp. TaxID=306 RepID=UPI002735D4F9|nr:coproporphyrinogen III oxidase [Pseudomonas sp.]MDP3844997.1 coproporphyrinogen III oxidase [Pseudomonas sp.]